MNLKTWTLKMDCLTQSWKVKRKAWNLSLRKMGEKLGVREWEGHEYQMLSKIDTKIQHSKHKLDHPHKSWTWIEKLEEKLKLQDNKKRMQLKRENQWFY